MARQKEFSPDRVVDKALEIFRLRGYAATSVDDLVNHLGIGRGSLYDTFGSKHALYLAALDRYLESGAPNDTDSTNRSAKQAIAAILYAQVKAAIQAAPLGGCFLVNSAVELGARDAQVAQRVRENLDHGERIFYALLSQDATLDFTSRERRKLAQFFVNTTLGIRLQAKVSPDSVVLNNIVAIALGTLER